MSMEQTLYSIYEILDAKKQKEYLKLIKEDYPKETYENLIELIELNKNFG